MQALDPEIPKTVMRAVLLGALGLAGSGIAALMPRLPTDDPLDTSVLAQNLDQPFSGLVELCGRYVACAIDEDPCIGGKQPVRTNPATPAETAGCEVGIVELD